MLIPFGVSVYVYRAVKWQIVRSYRVTYTDNNRTECFLIWSSSYVNDKSIHSLLAACALYDHHGRRLGLFCRSQHQCAIMSSVEPHTRGEAAGILNMLGNTGQMLSIAIVFPLALSKIPFGAVQQVFINGGGMGQFASVIPAFLSGLHLAFLVSFVLSIIIVAAVVSALRPSHSAILQA